MKNMELIGLSISPYSLRAKWALDHHQLQYRYSEHLIIFGVPMIRFKLKKWTGDFTVPALIDGETRLMDSFEIAEYADQMGEQPKLFREGKFDEIRYFNDISEAICDAGRALVTFKVAKNKEALEALVPPMPSALRKLFALLSPMGISYLNSSFNIMALPAEKREEDLRKQLLLVREALQKSGGQYLLGEFTYADITIAASLQMVKPHEKSLVARNESTRTCWTQDKIAAEFSDLIAWRDQLYSKHFPKK